MRPDAARSRTESHHESHQSHEGSGSVIELTARIGHDDYFPQIPPGEYEVGYVRAKRLPMWGRPRWAITFQVVKDGPAFGTHLVLWVPAVPKGKRPSPGMAMASLYVIATGLPPPRDLWRRKPREILSDCYFRARVVMARRDSRRVERPEAASYSKIECLLERTAGTPPLLRGRTG